MHPALSSHANRPSLGPIALRQSLVEAIPWEIAAQAPGGFCIRESDGTGVCGYGQHVELRASGSDRFVDLLGQMQSVVCDGDPIWIGGAAFAPKGGQDHWKHFGSARLVLPEVCYQQRADGSKLRIQTTQKPLVHPRPMVRTTCAATLQGDDHHWQSLLRSTIHAIGAGHAEKLVVAHHRRASLATAPSRASVLAALLASPAGTTYYIHNQGSVFAGQSPELLVASDGENTSTEAVAGTGANREQLLTAKNLREHEIVVDFIVGKLAQAGVVGQHRPAPDIRRLPGLMHLVTPIAAKGAMHPLEWLSILHPTPAVAGRPRSAALEWIAEHEEDRGWYAGPVGYCTASGVGRFFVALRGMLMQQEQLHFYSGVGLIADSTRNDEHSESELKLRATAKHLGVELL